MADDQDKSPPEHATSSDIFVDPLADLASSDVVEGDISLAPPIEQSGANSPTSSEPENSEVENMLDHALSQVSAEDSPSTALKNPATEPEIDPYVRYFDITLSGLENVEQRRIAREILERFPASPIDPDLETKMESVGAYKITRLREFHAYVLAANLYQAGIESKLQMNLPGWDLVPPSVDPQSLLVTAKDSEEAISTGAIAVSLPEGPGEVFLATVGAIPGYTPTLNKGIVSAHSSIARAFFRESEKEARLVTRLEELNPTNKKTNPQKLGLPRAEIDKVFHNLLTNLQKEAFRRGANGVIGIQISGFAEAHSLAPEADQIRLIATGTAVLLEPVKSSG